MKRKLPGGAPAPEGDDDLLDVVEAARRLRLHPVTMRRYCSEKRIPAVRVGGRWLIRVATVKAVARGEIDLSTNLV